MSCHAIDATKVRSTIKTFGSCGLAIPQPQEELLKRAAAFCLTKDLNFDEHPVPAVPACAARWGHRYPHPAVPHPCYVRRSQRRAVQRQCSFPHHPCLEVRKAAFREGTFKGGYRSWNWNPGIILNIWRYAIYVCSRYLKVCKYKQRDENKIQRLMITLWGWWGGWNQFATDHAHDPVRFWRAWKEMIGRSFLIKRLVLPSNLCTPGFVPNAQSFNGLFLRLNLRGDMMRIHHGFVGLGVIFCCFLCLLCYLSLYVFIFPHFLRRMFLFLSFPIFIFPATHHEIAFDELTQNHQRKLKWQEGMLPLFVCFRARVSKEKPVFWHKSHLSHAAIHMQMIASTSSQWK